MTEDFQGGILKLLIRNIGLYGSLLLACAWYCVLRTVVAKEIPIVSSAFAIAVTIWVLYYANAGAKIDAEIEEAKNYEKALEKILARKLKEDP